MEDVERVSTPRSFILKSPTTERGQELLSNFLHHVAGFPHLDQHLDSLRSGAAIRKQVVTTGALCVVGGVDSPSPPRSLPKRSHATDLCFRRYRVGRKNEGDQIEETLVFASSAWISYT